MIVTADHSHVMSLAGYSLRASPILGVVEDGGGKPVAAADGEPYAIFSYANGPGAAFPKLKKDATEARPAGVRPMAAAADMAATIMEGAVNRVRPKMMTVVAIMAGLLPILWSTGTSSEVMQRIAVPMIGGMVSSTILTLVVIPAIYALMKGFALNPRASTARAPEDASTALAD